METKKIEVSVTINASPQKIWRLWTQPNHITEWHFANDDWHCPAAENDLRVGGRFNYRMEAKDGSLGFDFVGIYDEIEDQEKITFTLGDGRESTTTFESLGKHTEVTTILDAEPQNPIDFQREGWQTILNNFKTYVESQ